MEESKIMEEAKNSSDSTPGNAGTGSSSKPMDSKKDVADSNDPKTGQDFRGYPVEQDIMSQESGSHKVDMDIENLPDSNNQTQVSQRYPSADDKKKAMTPQPGLGDDDLGIQEGTEADVDEDDLVILNATNGEIGMPQNVDNEDLNTDLDIPGSDLDDENEAIGEEDEENNYYSLGGDNHSAQEENPDSDPQRAL
jgi:hypothetical protein